MKRLRIEHTTGFDYPGEVGASYNEARMLPTTSDSQFVLSSQLDIEPSTNVNYYVDYFGTRVAAFDVLSPHGALTITARSLVEVRPRPIEHADISWDALAALRETARERHVEGFMLKRRTSPYGTGRRKGSTARRSTHSHFGSAAVESGCASAITSTMPTTALPSLEW